jgi:hypothetical protein
MELYLVKITVPTLKGRLVRAVGVAGEETLVGRGFLNHYKVTLHGLQNKIEIE